MTSSKNMGRGGYREGAGGKPKWIHGKTKTIRVPEALADKILEIAQILDEGGVTDHVTESNVINLSGVSIHSFDKGSVVYVADLIAAGYTLKPDRLVHSIGVRKRLENQERANALKTEISSVISELNHKELKNE